MTQTKQQIQGRKGNKSDCFLIYIRCPRIQYIEKVFKSLQLNAKQMTSHFQKSYIPINQNGTKVHKIPVLIFSSVSQTVASNLVSSSGVRKEM